MAEGRLYSADNLDVLRGGYIAPESVDLVYLDPPFNSQRDYNILYRERDESPSRAQIKAFEDSWHWDAEARGTYDELVAPDSAKLGTPPALSTIIRALHDALPNRSDMFAYLVMMAPRLIELRRVLKPTGSLYLHCDPTASHYLKVMLDAIFGPAGYRGEIVWRRTRAHNDKTIRRYGAIHDTILYYSKSDRWTFNPQFTDRDRDAPKTHDLYRHTDGNLYRKGDCRAPGDRGPKYEWNGHVQHWRFAPEERDRLIAEGRIVYTKSGMPRVLRPVDPDRGSPLQDVWTDIDAPNSGSDESLGYPTQKPVALLERIIRTSSNEGDVVLDPFCGCGTAIEAAHNLKREWIGIDITHLAIGVIRDRRLAEFPGLQYRLFSIPRDLETARSCAAASPYEFQFWAARKIGAFVLGSDPHAREGKRGADRGVDGLIRFRSASEVEEAVVSVKGGHVGPSAVRDLRGTMERRKAPIGVLLTLQEPTGPMHQEAVDAGFVRRGDEKFPRLQILTIAEMIEGKMPSLPGQKERPPAPGQTLSLPGMERPAPPPPKGVLVKVPEKSAESAMPLTGERKPAKRAERSDARRSSGRENK